MKLKANYDFRHGYRKTAAAATGCMSQLVTDIPLGFFLWGYVKDLVYQVGINDLAHLKTRITNTINSVTPEMLGRVWQEWEYRLDICRATNGSHIELH